MAKMDNLISRQAAIDVLSLGKEILSRVLDDMDVVGIDREKYSWGLGLIESYVNDIEELPSVQPEQKKGHWIEKGVNADKTHNIVCSKCGEGYKTRGHAKSIATRAKWRFCPNCGADMRE